LRCKRGNLRVISIKKKHEEIEKYFRDKEKAFDLKKRKEFQHIGFLKENVEKKCEQVAFKKKKVDAEKIEKLMKEQLADNQNSLVTSAHND
jgi:precorrin-2 methylase